MLSVDRIPPWTGRHVRPGRLPASLRAAMWAGPARQCRAQTRPPPFLPRLPPIRRYWTQGPLPQHRGGFRLLPQHGGWSMGAKIRDGHLQSLVVVDDGPPWPGGCAGEGRQNVSCRAKESWGGPLATSSQTIEHREQTQKCAPPNPEARYYHSSLFTGAWKLEFEIWVYLEIGAWKLSTG